MRLRYTTMANGPDHLLFHTNLEVRVAGPSALISLANGLTLSHRKLLFANCSSFTPSSAEPRW